jgi:hypothetical protein
MPAPLEKRFKKNKVRTDHKPEAPGGRFGKAAGAGRGHASHRADGPPGIAKALQARGSEYAKGKNAATTE